MILPVTKTLRPILDNSYKIIGIIADKKTDKTANKTLDKTKDGNII